MKSVNVKMMTAVAGAGALLAMGGLTVATSSAEPEEPTPGPVPTEQATLGETATDTTAATTPTTPSAEPVIVGPAELPTEEQGLPG